MSADAGLPLNPWLIVGGTGCALAALAHIAVIAGGPDWYRWFGAGEPMARAPALLTLGIAAMLLVWAAYAFAGAGIFARLPWMRVALAAISVVLLGRGLAALAPESWRPDLSLTFKLWSSLIVLALGVCYAVGAWQVWPALSAKELP